MSIKYSIIIPTYNHAEDGLKPCLRSIAQYTRLHDGEVEVIVVANGCTDNTEMVFRMSELLPSHRKLLQFPEPLGFPKAVNHGVRAARGEYIILMNNDVQLLEQPKNKWLEILEQPFKEFANAGISGPLRLGGAFVNRPFVCFFLAMIHRSVYDAIGFHDESFGIGAYEDADFTYRAEDAGFSTHQVPDENPMPVDGQYNVSKFPVFHPGELTMHDDSLVDDWSDKHTIGLKLLADKYGSDVIKKYPKPLKDVNITEKEIFDIKRKVERQPILTPDFTMEDQSIYRILQLIRTKSDPSIVELGSGDSTIKIAQKLKEHRSGHIYSVEENQMYASKVKAQLTAEGLNDYATILVREIKDGWYDTTELEENLPTKIDILIIDGPFAGSPERRDIRQHAVAFFKDKMRATGDIVVDDTHQDKGMDVAIMWLDVGEYNVEEIGRTSFLTPTGFGFSGTDKGFKWTPKISVIVPCHPQEKQEDIEGLQENLHATGYDNFELIIFTDKEARGAAYARNEGMKRASGDLYLFIDVRTRLMDNTLKLWVNYLYDHPDVDFVYGSTQYPDAKVYGTWHKQYVLGVGYLSTTSLIRKEHAIEWDEDIKRHTDTEYWIRMWDAGKTGKLVEDTGVLALYSNEISTSKRRSTYKWKYKIQEKHQELLELSDEDMAKAPHNRVLCVVITRGRYDSTLPMTLTAIANQTIPPTDLLIVDDNVSPKDLRNDAKYRYIFHMFDRLSINWRVVYSYGNGIPNARRLELEGADKQEFIWRVDDDEVPQFNTLELLLRYIKEADEVGAVGGLVLDPTNCTDKKMLEHVKGDIGDVMKNVNVQWLLLERDTRPFTVEHLYSTFLYRAEYARHIGGYNARLSPVGHHEETFLTYSMFKFGYKLIVVPQAITWHYRNPEGGLREHLGVGAWAHDEDIFRKWLRVEHSEEAIPEYKVFVLNEGIGDHYAFKQVWQDLKAKHRDKELWLALTFPAVFADEKDAHIISIAEAEQRFGNKERFSVYAWADENNFKGHITEAYRRFYS